MVTSDPEREMMKARLKLMLDYPFFGHLALNLQMEKADWLYPPTMATDGIHLYWHPDFVKNSTFPELVGVIMHEIGHVMFLHPIRGQERDPERFNWACDYAVNDIVMAEVNESKGKLALPSGVLYDKQWTNKSAEYIYPRIPEPPKIGGGGMGKGSGKGTLDSHEPWKNWAKGDVKDAEGNSISPAELEEKVREEVASASNAARQAGKMPANLQEKIDGVLQPKLPWKEILRDMVVSCAHNDYKLVPPNKKHLWRDMFLPQTTGEEINVACAIDSSGSIGANEAKMFLSEISGICQAFENFTIWLFVCDTVIHARYEIHPHDDIPNVIVGRGGTSFRAPFEAAVNEDLPISSFIYLTDMEPNDDFPPIPPFPVIWVSVGQRKAPYGEVIDLPRDEVKV